MSTYNYKPGLSNAASYQVSGIPYVKGPIENAASGAAGVTPKISFPQVTRWIKITNTDGGDGELICGFSQNGVQQLSNAFVVPDGQTLHLELKVTELYYTGSVASFGVVAGLTGIEAININNPSVSPSGSNWSGSLGAEVG
tara:strand:- start:84 stop:506 length:423 start_codon:yes stop_codon:yes gene_type:complete